MRSNVRRILVAAIVAVLGAASLDGVAFAAWQAHGTGATASAEAATMPAGATPSASVSGSSVTVSWAARTIAGTPVPGYVVKAYDAGTNATRAVGASCAGTITATACTESNAPAGSWRYTVTPKNANWSGTESGKSASVTVAAPGPAIALTFPTSGSAYSTASWNAGCSSSICGTASAPAGIKKIEVSVKQGSKYWNPSSGAFNTSSRKLMNATVNGANWSLPFPGTNFSDGSYTIDADVTDQANKTATTSVTFTIDETAPSGNVVTLPATIHDGQKLWLVSPWDTGSGIASVSYYSCAGTNCSPSTLIGTSTAPTSFFFDWDDQPTDGPYRVNARITDAAGNVGTTASQTVTTENHGPRPTAIEVTNGGTAGVVDTGDSVRITFNEPLDVPYLCGAWYGNTVDHVLDGDFDVTVHVDNNAGTTGNDTLSVDAGSCAIQLGSVDLGSPDWVSSSRDFVGGWFIFWSSPRSTFAYDASAAAVTITLGSGPGGGSHVGPKAMTYTPDSHIRDVAGNGIDTTPFTQPSQRF